MVSMAANDDVWAEVDDLGEREWTKLSQDFGNIGFKEGLEVGKEKLLQTGFNQGYREGCHVGLELGFSQGILRALCELSELTADAQADGLRNNLPKLDQEKLKNVNILMEKLKSSQFVSLFKAGRVEDAQDETNTHLPSEVEKLAQQLTNETSDMLRDYNVPINLDQGSFWRR